MLAILRVSKKRAPLSLGVIEILDEKEDKGMAILPNAPLD
jgi:hypothetical protein